MSVVASRYARALIDAMGPDGMESGLVQLRSFAAVIANEDARKLLLNPVIPQERREAFIDAVSESGGFDGRVCKLIKLIVERRRLDIFSGLTDAYQRLLDERNGIVRVLVSSASLLAESDRKAIFEHLKDATGKQVELEVEQDRSLIGGVVVKIGGTVYDGSIKQQLQGFKAQLLDG